MFAQEATFAKGFLVHGFANGRPVNELDVVICEVVAFFPHGQCLLSIDFIVEEFLIQFGKLETSEEDRKEFIAKGGRDRVVSLSLALAKKVLGP